MRGRREWVLCLLLLALTLAVYSPVRHCAFIDYDDPQFIAENPQINSGLTWHGFVYAWTQPVVGNWHPVTTLSHMLDCQLFGPKPSAHHLVNAFLHGLSAAALFLALCTFTGAPGRSFLVAALFALHPLRVESVAWISERKDVLSGLFFFLTLWAWAKAKTTAAAPLAKTPPQPARTARWSAIALLFYAIGLMSKPMVVTLPCVLLLLDLWPLRRMTIPPRNLWPLLREKLPFFGLAALCAAITLSVQRSAGAMSFFPRLGLGDRLVNAGESYVRYLGKFVWPTKLAIVYPHPAFGYANNDAWPAWAIAAAFAGLLIVTLLCLWRLRRQPFLAVGWFWFLGTLVPVIGLVQVGEQAMANRYTYIPLVGPAFALVWGIAESLRPEMQGAKSPLSVPALGAILSAPVLIACAWLTQLQLQHWRGTVPLFSYAVAVTPDNPSAHFALGSGLEKEGKINEAAEEYRAALAINPRFTKAHYNLGQLASKAGDFASAAVHFQSALDSSPDDPASRLNLANCLQRLGRTREAIAHYESALRHDPNSTEALNNMAWILATDRDPQLRNGHRAVELAGRAVHFSGSKVPIMIGTLAAAYAEAGQFQNAVQAAEAAAALAAAQGQDSVAARNRELQELYLSGKPYHEQ